MTSRQKLYSPALFRLCYVLMFLQAGDLYGQEQIKFQHLDSEDGLSENVVYAIQQDRRGYLWIGTWDGLNRYDGYGFKKYYYSPVDSTTIPANTINCIYEDRKGGLWIGTNRGLCRYNYENAVFSRIYLKELRHYNVLHITDVNDAELLVETGDSIFLLNKGNLNVRNVAFLGEGGKFYPALNTPFTKDNSGAIFLSSSGLPGLQVYKYDYGENVFKPNLVNMVKLPSEIGKVSSLHFITDAKQQRWFATDKEKILVFDKDRNLLPISDHPLLQNKFTVQCLYNDPGGDVWIGTEQGLLHYEADTDELFWYTSNLSEHSLSSPVVNCVFADKTGVVWIGTLNGLNKLVPAQRKIRHLTSSHGLISNFILGIFAESDQRLRIHYNLGVREFSRFNFADHTAKHFNKGNYPEESYLGEVLIKKSHLLSTTSRRHFKERFFASRQNRFIPPLLIADSSQRIWYSNFFSFGCYSPGPAGKYVDDTLALFMGEIYDMQMDNGDIWLATANEGLAHYNTVTGQLKKYSSQPSAWQSISSNEVLCLLPANDGIWLGTKGGGLNFFDRQTKAFKHYTSEQGLCNNSIYSMVMDKEGNLWLGTSNGLSKFDTGRKVFRNYFRSDGLINSEFNRYSAISTADGLLFFGGMNGIDFFDPQDIIDNVKPPQLLVTDIKIFNKSIGQANPILLSHKNNYISFEFAAIDYRNPAANKFAYKLEGVDKDWVYVENRNYAGYPALQPGRYRFLVKGSNSDGIWNDKPVEIKFTIRTPWWRTAWFYIGCGLVVCALLYTAYSFRIRQLKKMLVLRTKISRDLHDEVGATLTSISFLSEVARKQHSANISTTTLLEKIGEYSRNMIAEMNDIVWAINPSNDKFDKIFDRMQNYASTLSASRNMEFHFTASQALKDVSLSMQQRKNIYMVFKEAVNNSVKYSEASIIKVILDRSNGHVSMEVIDDGKGFDTSVDSRGNGLSNIRARAKEIRGKCSIASSAAAGTIVRIEIPITQNA